MDFAQIWAGLEKAALKSVNLFTIFALTLPSPGRVEEEINKCSRHLTPKIPPLLMITGRLAWRLADATVREGGGVLLEDISVLLPPQSTMWGVRWSWKMFS